MRLVTYGKSIGKLLIAKYNSVTPSGNHRPLSILFCFLKVFSLYLFVSQSKRMMNAKQDQYREYVVNKLLDETTIAIVNNWLLEKYPNNRYITIKTPFYDTFTVITPKDGEIKPQQHVWNKMNYNGATPQGFPILMGQYAITESHEVSKVWLQYKSIVGSMIHDEVKKQKTL